MKSRGMVLALIAMGVVTFALVVIAAYFLVGDRLNLSPKGTIHTYIQSPPIATVGEDVQLILTVRNDTNEYISIDEIRLPKSVLQSAAVVSILPGTLNHTDYADETGYQIGFLMGPGDQREFEITLLPRQTDDVVGDLKVLAASGELQAVSGFRMIFEMPVAQSAFELTASPSPEPTSTLEIIPPTPTESPTPVVIPYAAVVKITAKLKHSSYLRDAWSGSGSIVSPDGLILTNAHLVTPGQNFRPDAWIISITEDPALPPPDLYYAEPIVVDEDLDLAVLQITKDIKQKPVDPQTLRLPYVPLGDSSQLKLGDPLIILGYPGIGGETITLTRGDVGGFTVTSKLTEPAFIKTSAAISGGTSGGMAMDQYGRLVAVPTQLGYGQRTGDLVDCRVIADTNGDGDVDQRDVCVPVGGFINALRPINLARPLIEQARRILEEQNNPTPYPEPSPQP